MADAQTDISPKQWSLKHVAYHEAAHAVIAWNFGFSVLRIVVNRADRSGYILPFGLPADGPEPIGDILASLAGGVAHRCYSSGVDRQEVRGSDEDFRLAMRQIHSLAELPPGAEIYMMGYFADRVRELMDLPEIQAQVQAVAKSVMPTGMMTKWQLEKTLKILPVSARAKKQCHALKQRIEGEWQTVVEKAIADAPKIAAMSGYEELTALMKQSKSPAQPDN